MLRTLKHPHLRPELLAFQLTTTSVSTPDIGGGDLVSATRNAAGKSTLVPKTPLVGTPIIMGSIGANVADGGYFIYDTDPTGSALVGAAVNASGVADDGTYYMAALNWASTCIDRLGSRPQAVTSSARSPRLEAFSIAAAGTVTIGGSQATVVKAASVYTITLKTAFGRTPLAFVTTIGAAQTSAKIVSTSASTIVVSTFNSSEAATDEAFYLVVLGWDSTDQQWGMGKAIQVPQRKPRLEAFNIADAGIVIGTTDATFVDNGTGSFTLTFTQPFARAPIVIATGKAGRAQVSAAATTTAVTVLGFDASGSAEDDSISLFIVGYDSASEF